MPIRVTILFALLTTPAFAQEAKPPAEEMNGLPLVFFEDFEDGKADGWEPTDPKAWRIKTEKGPNGVENTVYDQFVRKSNFTPPVRSPYNRALRKDVYVGSFVMDVKFKSTIKDYPHRDLCLFFGYQDDGHLHYVHFGKKTDDHANQIFIVNGKPRTKISTKTTDGTQWTDEWHRARIVRDVKSGSIEVYFDNMETPVMTAKDTTFTWGRVGIGSFDDAGWFDDVTLWGEVVEPPKE